MKKNKMMRLSAILLVAVLLSLSVISGTWAKYVTSGEEQTQTVTVAKWGVTVTANTPAEKAYAIDGSELGENLIVEAAGSGYLIAPGVRVDLCTFNLGGTPEVASEVTYTASLTLAGWEVDSNEYCPLVFVVKTTAATTEIKIGSVIAEETIDTVDKLETAVAAAIAKASKQFNAGSTLAADLEVYCYWAFEVDTATNAKDTALTENDPLPTVAFTINCTVAQINELN